MSTLDGYRVAKSLASGAQTRVHSALRERDGTRVVLKAYSGSSGRARAERELQVLQAVRGPGVPEALELQHQGSGAVLVLAFVEGESLAASLASGTLTLAARLRIAVELAECIARVHDARIIHKDIRPENVLLDRRTQQPWLIDFGRASALGSASDRGVDADFPQRALLYVSPEGTGRMDRGLDHRSDLYSIGALLYHMLTDRPPFELKEALELVHAHMAVLPEPPIAVRSDCPATLSRIVMKLLQKQPEERYQSASALCDDLRSALEQLQHSGAIADDFPLGTSDSPQRPLFPKRVYGREAELARLEQGFERASRGAAEVWLIKGPPGAGKSALADQLKARVHAAKGYLAPGKFDLYRRDVPYSGFVSAFDSLLQQRLAESSAQLERFRERVLAGLGNLAGALARLVPDLCLVIGEVPAPPRLEPEQVRVRLALAVQRFVRACAAPEHPLVLCLDDLQWADGGSLALIEELALASEPCALLLLGTYRDDAIDAQHPLRPVLERLEAGGVHTLQVGPLSEMACVDLLASALQRSPQETLPLARLVAQKTANLPLLVEQFIGHARELGLLTFESGGRGWIWDEAGIRAATIPEGAVGLLAAKIERLEPNARRVLELASCVSDRFDARLLAELGGGEPEALHAGLYKLSDEGLIAPCATGFRFVHDRTRCSPSPSARARTTRPRSCCRRA
jgi:predicted Ser/Thr protein kinase